MRTETIAVNAVVQRRTILVVEDDPDLRPLLAWVLEESGYQVVTAADGIEALVRLAASVPDLVIVDLRMPALDGWRLLAALRRSPRWASLPVIVHTAEERAIPSDVTAVLRKPVDPAVLLGTVGRHCR